MRHKGQRSPSRGGSLSVGKNDACTAALRLTARDRIGRKLLRLWRTEVEPGTRIWE